MKWEALRKYLLNGLWLVLPPMVFNIVFVNRLPPAYQPGVFWKDIPMWLGVGENLFRALVVFLPVMMPLDIRTRTQQIGLGIYFSGLLVYFLSWFALMQSPDSAWSASAAGFMAPACTPAIWLAGIGLIGGKWYLRIPYQPWMYVGVSLIFLFFHNLHAWTIYARMA
jgi:hypothetical protein